MASCKQSRRHLESAEDKFLLQVLNKQTKGEVLLDLMFTNVEELIKEAKIGGSLGSSDHTLVEFCDLEGYEPG